MRVQGAEACSQTPQLPSPLHSCPSWNAEARERSDPDLSLPGCRLKSQAGISLVHLSEIQFGSLWRRRERRMASVSPLLRSERSSEPTNDANLSRRSDSSQTHTRQFKRVNLAINLLRLATLPRRACKGLWEISLSHSWPVEKRSSAPLFCNNEGAR